MDALLASMVASSRLPRKIAERVRLAIHAQRAFRDPARRRRRRGRGAAGAPHLADATQLLRISVEATGEGKELLERWTSAPEETAAAEREPAAPPLAAPRDEVSLHGHSEAASAAGEAQPGGRRRRRRRGGKRRRRRGPGAGAPAGGAPGA
jgi:poly(A) polymerase